MKNKKSIAIEMLLWLTIGVFAVLVIFYIIPKLLGKEASQASDLISSTKDFDGDGVQDYFDRCDCDYGDSRNDGCPPGMEKTGDTAITREKECDKKKA